MKKSSQLIVLLFLPCIAFGQMQEYCYKKSINGIVNPWHRLELPIEVLSKLKTDQSDLRIYGITNQKDTIEAPYILKVGHEVPVQDRIPLQILNQSQSGDTYFITIRVPSKNVINHIALNFNEKNFDRNVKIEGSQTQKEWFLISENQRILSIQNAQTTYSYTELNFEPCEYAYYRISFQSSVTPKLQSAEITNEISKTERHDEYEIAFTQRTDSDRKVSVLEFELDFAMPIYKLNLAVSNDFDFYRPLRIGYLVDSFLDDRKNEETYQYRYRTLYTGTLSSLEENEFKFKSTLVKKVRISIENANNQALDYESIKAYSYKHDLLVRFTEPASYSLYYGSKKAQAPSYDISMFENQIPTNLTSLSLGKELKNGDSVQLGAEQDSFFKNKAWLWGLMILIILLLGWYTLKMMRNVSES